MKMHVRHFVSQRFGKSTVTVDFCDDTAGVVSIARACPDRNTVAFTFETARVAQMTGETAPCAERLMRIAIQQAHRHFVLKGARGLFGTTVALAVGTQPWIGDLSDAPYGGATQGYDGLLEALP